MKLIKDVKPSRLAKIFEKKNEIIKIFIEYFHEKLVKGFNLKYVYFFSVQKKADKNSYKKLKHSKNGSTNVQEKEEKNSYSDFR